MFIILAVLSGIGALISFINLFSQNESWAFSAMLGCIVSTIVFIKLANMEFTINWLEKKLEEKEKPNENQTPSETNEDGE